MIDIRYAPCIISGTEVSDSRATYGFTEGYISFFFSQASQKWIIKSFHRTSDCGETAFTLAFKKVGLLTGFEE
jgi:ABC-type sulfate transport system substrate-binding protein